MHKEMAIKGDKIRACLDRRCLEAHLKYAILLVYRDNPEHFPSWKVSPDVCITCGEVSSIYYSAFSTRYTGKCACGRDRGVTVTDMTVCI